MKDADLLLFRGVKEYKTAVSEENIPPGQNLSRDPEAIYEAGKKLFFQADYSSALNYFEQALRLYQEAGKKTGVFEVWNHIGYLFLRKGDFKKSHEYYEKALQLGRETGDRKDIGSAFGNLGMLYDEEGNYPLALEYYHKALHIYEESGFQRGIAQVYNNIGIIHHSQENLSLALDYFNKSLAYYEGTDDKHTLSRVLGNVGYIHGQLGDFQLALQEHERERRIKEELNDKWGLALTYNYLGQAYQKANDHSLALDYFQKALDISREMNNSEGEVGALYNLAAIYLNKDDEAAFKYASEALTKSQQHSIKRFEKDSLELLYQISRRRMNSDAALEYLERFLKLKDELQGTEVAGKIAKLKMGYDLDLSEKERQLTEKILFNVLPKSIATRIRNGEEKIMERFPAASILFADIVGFTTWSSKRNVDEVAKMLDQLFKVFDELALEFGIEKIKTIGDAYMCVAGLPEPCDDHAERVCKMALAMNQKIRMLFPNGEIRLRIGIHTGEVIAGVIGKNKYAYDLWGDTVNTASRMESHGIPDKIQATEELKKQVEAKFQFEERGEIEVKGKGRMRTWFLKEV